LRKTTTAALNWADPSLGLLVRTRQKVAIIGDLRVVVTHQKQTCRKMHIFGAIAWVAPAIRP
jgi:hypothetical protein